MIWLTLGTVLAFVARHTSTRIVIYFVVTSCTVFARIRAAIIDIWQTKIIVEWCEYFCPHNLYLYKMWTRRKMTNHTLGTVLALVASHTGTTIVIYFNSTSCTVLARFRITIVDIWKTYKSNSNISNLPPQSECIDN